VPTVIKGGSTTGGRKVEDYQANSIPVSIDDAFDIIDSKQCPLTTHLLTSKYGVKEIPRQVHKMMEKEHPPYVFRAAGAATAATASTTLNISGASDWLVAGDILAHAKNGTVETIYVSTTPTADSGAFYVRGIGDSELHAIAAQDTLIKICNAHQEISEAPDARLVKEVEKTFYAGLQRLTTEMSWSAAHTKTINDPDREFERAMKTREFKRLMETNSIFGFGTDNAYSSGNTKSPTSKGLLQCLTTHRKVIQTLTYAELDNAFRGPAEYHSDGWMLLCSPFVSATINRMAKDYIQTSVTENRFGKRIKYLDTSYGEVEIVTEPSWTYGMTAGMAIALPKPIDSYFRMLLFDIDGDGPKPHWKLNVNDNNNRSAYKDEILACYGYQFKQEKRGLLITGVAA